MQSVTKGSWRIRTTWQSLPRFEDRGRSKGEKDYEDLERTTWETQDLRTFAEMSEDSEEVLIVKIKKPQGLHFAAPGLAGAR